MLQSAPVHELGRREAEATRIRRAWDAIASRPATAFVVLSLLFGSVTLFLNPPLRGPDEAAHFLRIYSYAQGELLPAHEVEGRKGTRVPAQLLDQFAFFEDARNRFGREEVRYSAIMQEYAQLGETVDLDNERGAAFAAFAGTEGYTPAAYAPYIPAAALGRLLGLEFVGLLNLMRLSGLVILTVVAAYAIALTPALKWAFALIAMLPASLYARTVLSADGAALSFTLVIAAVCLAVVHGTRPDRPWERALWMTLCVFSKQPQLAFVLLEGLTRPLNRLWRRWRTVAIVVLPGLILSPLWVYAVSADIAVWRMQLDRPPEHFQILWKLGFLWEHPWHLPKAMWISISGDWPSLWRQVIGVLGWLDVPLWSWSYPILALLLAMASVEALRLGLAARARVAILSFAIVLGYVVLVYLIFFLAWTPPDAENIWGVQGRYFVVALPAAAVAVGALLARGLPAGWLAVVSLAASILAGGATVEAVWRVHW